MRPASLAEAALPTAVTEPTEATAFTELYTLADAKNALSIPLTETYKDAALLTIIEQSQALLEKISGLKFAPTTGAVAEYVLCEEVRSLSIPESDVSAITSVVEYDGSGVPTTLVADTDYEVKERAYRTYITRLKEGYFPISYDNGLSVEITFNRNVVEGSNSAKLMRAAMSYLVVEFYKGAGATTEKSMSNNPAFMRTVRLLQAEKDYV